MGKWATQLIHNPEVTTMLKNKLIAIIASLAFATGGLVAPAAAQAANYYFYSICTVGSPPGCPGGPGAVKFGPFTTLALCNSTWSLTLPTFWGIYPRSLSSCFAQ